MHETELWLKRLTTVTGVSQKVKAMTFMVTVEASMHCVQESLSVLGNIAGAPPSLFSPDDCSQRRSCLARDLETC